MPMTACKDCVFMTQSKSQSEFAAKYPDHAQWGECHRESIRLTQTDEGGGCSEWPCVEVVNPGCGDGEETPDARD